MEIAYKDLTNKYGWEEIEPDLSRMYPASRRSIAEYREAYGKLSIIAPIQSRMRIVVEKHQLPTGGFWYEVYGRNGTLVKDVFQHDQARERLKDALQEEQAYDLSYTDWAEIMGMAIDSSTLALFPENDIVAHVLVLITKRWHSDERLRKVLEEVEAIKHGRQQDLVQRKALGSSGFLQVWSEKEDGEFHGRYTVYWDDGAMLAEQGIIIDGNKEGVWTYWERNGKIRNQIRFSCDREVEEKLESPWWDDVEDQRR